jgi:diacylglycerol kinase (ATP)
LGIIVLRLYHATLNTIRGLTWATKSEAALRQELALLVIAIPLGVFLAHDAGWYVAMVGILIMTICVELLNTCIEKLADHVTPDEHPQIGLVKDMGSAAVFCMLCLSGFVWIAALAVRFGFI